MTGLGNNNTSMFPLSQKAVPRIPNTTVSSREIGNKLQELCFSVDVK